MESIETLNERLSEHFGHDSDTNDPIFRIVWSEEQFEKRLVSYTDSGIQLLFPEVRKVKKYPYIRHLYVLERLVLVPEDDRNELAGLKKSYEPIWTYCDGERNPVPPIWTATKFVVDTLYAALGKTSMANYVEDTSQEEQERRIAKLHDELFGNETETTDALRYREGIVVPSSYGDKQ